MQSNCRKSVEFRFLNIPQPRLRDSGTSAVRGNAGRFTSVRPHPEGCRARGRVVTIGRPGQRTSLRLSHPRCRLGRASSTKCPGGLPGEGEKAAPGLSGPGEVGLPAIRLSLWSRTLGGRMHHRSGRPLIVRLTRPRSCPGRLR